MKRANYIGAPQFYNLNFACQAITAAFGAPPYLVGSSLERRDYRDVDVRCILDDAVFDRLFPKHPKAEQYDAVWSLLGVAISEWLSVRSGLPIDFQFQRRSDANNDYPGQRSAIGIFLAQAGEVMSA